MREILFRGKRVDNGEWVEGLPFGSIYGGFFNGAICAIRQTVEKYGDIHDVILETVGQFTGKFDKNGIRIFEGDRVVGEYGTIGVVKWDNEECSFLIDIGDDWQLMTDAKYTVIGNIHDNSELLQETHK